MEIGSWPSPDVRLRISMMLWVSSSACRSSGVGWGWEGFLCSLLWLSFVLRSHSFCLLFPCDSGLAWSGGALWSGWELGGDSFLFWSHGANVVAVNADADVPWGAAFCATRVPTSSFVFGNRC